MFSFPISWVILAFTAAGLSFLAAVWLYYDHRDKLYYDRMRVRRVHRCVRCDFVYTSRAVEGSEACPQCGQVNGPLQF